MITDLRNRFLSAVIFFILIASAVFTVPARADSGSPPPAPAPTGGSSASSSTTNTVSQIPTTVTNVAGGDGGGHKVKLDNQKAAYSAEAGDPIWCPATVAVPVAGAAGCSTSGFNTNLYTLTHAVQIGTWTPVVTNSNVWILGGADTSVNQIILNGSTLPGGISTLNTFTLTFKGGWTGIGGAINSANPSTFDGVGLKIINWHNNVTISNIRVNHAPIGQDGIRVQSTKNINLTNVLVSNGQENGAYLDDSAGTGVTITNSGFFQNDIQFDGSYGLLVFSAGPITATNLNVSGNDFHGAYLDNTFGTAGATLTGTNIFDTNNGFGLLVLSNGTITSGSISANTNQLYGAYLDNRTAASALPVTMTGSSTFTGNGTDGLDIYSHGNITVSNITSVGNGHYGGFLENDYSTSTPSAINVTGTNFFTKNGWDGLDALSDGPISLNNINANGNGIVGSDDGLYAQNSAATTAQSIILTGTNTFNENKNAGALFQASGKVSLSNVTASGNITSTGVTIQNQFLGSLKPQSVSLIGTNVFNKNQGDNLDISTYGAITLNNLTANNSLGGFGANLYYSSITSGNVTLNGVNNFNHNSSTGLNIVSNGTVLVNGLSALSNSGGGINIDNTTSTILSPVTLKGLTTINFNVSTGLQISSKGAVLTNGLDVEANGNGASIFNNFGSITSPVTLKGINTFNKNNGNGLSISSYGVVVTSALNANSNTGTGVFISNSGSSAFVPITLSAFSTFNYNGSGLTISSEGAITTNGLNVLANNGAGASFANDTSSTSHTITLKGVNSFNNNSGTGLNITSNGIVLVNNLTALTNSSLGVNITNTASSAASPVTLSGLSTLNYNNSNALSINTNGAVTTNGLLAVSNGGGVNIFNAVGIFTSPVTLNGSNTFDKNNGNGLSINSYGKVVTSALTATSNIISGVFITTRGSITTGGLKVLDNTGGNGASIDNSGAPSSQPVTLNGINIFNNNGGIGLNVSSRGTVLAGNLTALTNSGLGVNITNTASSVASPVTLSGLSTLNYNNSNALSINTNGAVTTNGLLAVSNGGGVNIFNAIGIFTSPVTLNGSNTFDKNNGNGLGINSYGKVVTSTLTATNNSVSGVFISTRSSITTGGLNVADNTGGNGASIDNSGAPSSQPVTLNGINTFNNNSGTGLNVSSRGTVLASNLTALNNSSTGVNITNSASSVASAVTLSGLSTFNYNNSTALSINTNGAVTTNGLLAVSNGGGVNIFNAIGIFTSPVTLKGNNTFDKNSGNGLTINSFGTVVTTPLIATSNSVSGVFISTRGSITTGGLNVADNTGGNGATIDNSAAASSQPVSLKGINTLNNNGGIGLNVSSRGTVLAGNLTALTNSSTGVNITNSASSVASAVTLSGLSTLNYNGSSALSINTNGAVTTNGLLAVSNGGGVNIFNAIGIFTSPVTLKGNNTFDKNSGNGLTINSYGKVVTSALNAKSNTGYGATIDNSSSSTFAPISLSGSSTFNYNSSGGLSITSKGAVSTSGLTTLSNGGTGATLTTSSSSSHNVSLNGINTFKHNSTGLIVNSNGTVIVNGLNSSNNLGTGAIIDNSSSTSASSASLIGISTLNFNGSSGLILVSKGTLLTNGLSALNNGSSGAIIDNSGSSSSSPVTLNGVNVFSNNGSNGLTLVSKGTLLTNGLSVVNNGSSGAIIDNSGASSAAPVTLMGLSTFNFNGSTGLILASKGALITNGLIVMSNGSSGALIDNSASTTSAPVTLKGVDTFSNNGSTGLSLITKGTVLTNGLTASNNGSLGAFIDNSGSSTIAPVTLKGINIFNNNGSTGLMVFSLQTITTSNLTANDNGSTGVELENNYLGATGAINVLGKNVMFNNGSRGLYLLSNGPVTMTNVSSKFNLNDGLFVDTTGSVSITCGSFIGNGTGQILGYGWETGTNVPSIKLIGVTSAGNYSGDSHLVNGGTVVTVTPKTCVLP